MKKGIKRRRLRNYILWTITFLMCAMSIGACVVFAFGKPSWVQAVLFFIGQIWNLAFVTANGGGVRNGR